MCKRERREKVMKEHPTSNIQHPTSKCRVRTHKDDLDARCSMFDVRRFPCFILLAAPRHCIPGLRTAGGLPETQARASHAQDHADTNRHAISHASTDSDSHAHTHRHSLQEARNIEALQRPQSPRRRCRRLWPHPHRRARDARQLRARPHRQRQGPEAQHHPFRTLQTKPATRRCAPRPRDNAHNREAVLVSDNLYKRKVSTIQHDLVRLEELISRHNFYDLETALEFENPATGAAPSSCRATWT